MRQVKTINYFDREELARKTCEDFFHELKLKIRHGNIVVSLCGGRSVQDFYKEITKHATKLSKEDWRHVHFFWTDERLVPPMHEESNYKLAMDLFLHELVEKGFVSEGNIHRYRGEDKPEEEVKRYSQELQDVSHGIIHIPILGVGPDCHVGALYPHHLTLDEPAKEFLFLEDSPKPPPRRATLSPRHIIESRSPFLFFLGEEKQEAYQKFLEGGDPHEAPCRFALQGDSGKAFVVTDLLL